MPGHGPPDSGKRPPRGMGPGEEWGVVLAPGPPASGMLRHPPTLS